jgi:hypothetical protein
MTEVEIEAAWQFSQIALPDPGIEALGGSDLGPARFDAHRLITDQLLALIDRGDIGIDPVVIAVLAAILDDAAPGFALIDRVPEVLEDRRRHDGVADDVVVGAQQLFFSETADIDEGLVAIGDDALGVGGGDDDPGVRIVVFSLRDREVDLHGYFEAPLNLWLMEVDGHPCATGVHRDQTTNLNSSP